MSSSGSTGGTSKICTSSSTKCKDCEDKLKQSQGSTQSIFRGLQKAVAPLTGGVSGGIGF